MPPKIMHQEELEKILLSMCKAAGVEGKEAEAAKDLAMSALKQEFGENSRGELDPDHVKQILDPNSAFTRGKGLAALLDVAIHDKTLSHTELLDFTRTFISILNPERKAKKEKEEQQDKELDDLMKQLKLDPKLKEAF